MVDLHIFESEPTVWREEDRNALWSEEEGVNSLLRIQSKEIGTVYLISIHPPILSMTYQRIQKRHHQKIQISLTTIID
jgi:hypothetical protein